MVRSRVRVAFPQADCAFGGNMNESMTRQPPVSPLRNEDPITIVHDQWAQWATGVPPGTGKFYTQTLHVWKVME